MTRKERKKKRLQIEWIKWQRVADVAASHTAAAAAAVLHQIIIIIIKWGRRREETERNERSSDKYEVNRNKYNKWKCDMNVKQTSYNNFENFIPV